MFGYDSTPEMQELPFSALVAPSELARVVQINAARETGQPAPAFYETRLRRKDGSEFDAEVSASSYTIAATTYPVAVVREITARKAGERAMRETAERLSAVFNSTSDGQLVYRVDDDGRLTGFAGAERDDTQRIEQEQRLAQTERRFRAMFQYAGVGMARICLETGRWLELNQYPDRRRTDPKFASFEQTMAEQHNLFRKHPKTIFINAHLGWLGHDLARPAHHHLGLEMPHVGESQVHVRSRETAEEEASLGRGKLLGRGHCTECGGDPDAEEHLATREPGEKTSTRRFHVAS
jgi:PAS domain S-box-containing protein